MMENLSFVLLGLAGVVTLLTYVGAHSSPVPIPNISKAGCFFAVGLVVIGVGAGLYPPVAKYNNCVEFCRDAVTVVDGDFGESEVFVSPGRVEFHACKKGAREAVEKAQKVSEELGQPIDVKMEAEDIVEARCASQGAERCTMTCFEGVPEA